MKKCYNNKDGLCEGKVEPYSMFNDQIVILLCSFHYKKIANSRFANIEFVSYDGKFPNKCSGSLIIKVNGKEIKFVYGALSPPDYYDGSDRWKVDEWPKDFPEVLKEDVIKIINKNISGGHCGGCT